LYSFGAVLKSRNNLRQAL